VDVFIGAEAPASGANAAAAADIANARRNPAGFATAAVGRAVVSAAEFAEGIESALDTRTGGGTGSAFPA